MRLGRCPNNLPVVAVDYTIRGAIEVYDFADSQEVDRRPAYPADFCSRTFTEMTRLMREMISPAVHQATERLSSMIKVMQELELPDQRANGALLDPIPNVPWARPRMVPPTS